VRRLSATDWSSSVAWVTVYDLRDNREYVETVQDATLHRPGYGLDPNPALFGNRLMVASRG
jgi:hypothetical protein